MGRFVPALARTGIGTSDLRGWREWEESGWEEQARQSATRTLIDPAGGKAAREKEARATGEEEQSSGRVGRILLLLLLLTRY